MNSNHRGYRKAVLTAKRTNQVADNISPVVSNHSFPLDTTLPHIKKALILLHKSHKDILVSLSPTQKLVLASYHRLIISMYDYLKSKSDGWKFNTTIGCWISKIVCSNSGENSTSERCWHAIFPQITISHIWSIQWNNVPNAISRYWLQRFRSCHQ